MVKVPDVEMDEIRMACVQTTTKSVDVSGKILNPIRTLLYPRGREKHEESNQASERWRRHYRLFSHSCSHPPHFAFPRMVRVPFSQLAGRIRPWRSPVMARLPDHYYNHAIQVQKEGERVHAVPIETKIADYTLADEETLRV